VSVTEAGIYPDMPEDEYHRDPVPEGSLSSTGARKMLPPSCPAIYRYEQDHPVFKDVFDFGSAAHKMVLGIGPKLKLIAAKDWRSKAAQDQRDEARANGFIPLLAPELERVEQMAAAIQDHPVAGALLDPRGGGQAELSMFWQEPEFGVWCRGRLDWLAAQRTSFGQPIVCDYKTSACAEPETFARKSAGEFGYHCQAAWYSDGYFMLTGEQPAFLFVVQEKTPPYLVSVVQLDPESEQIGRERNQRAIERYRDCAASGIWPGYTDDIELITLPPWQRSRGDDLL
jgi:hypothetical protein